MIRRAAITRGVPYTTTLSAASAATDAIMALRSRTLSVRSLQERAAAVQTVVQLSLGAS
jgi:carbamoyl-phosphate synthase large subunit